MRRRRAALPLADFDRWVQRRLLDPASVMFGEGALPPGEETSVAAAADPASCASALGAISAGVGRPSEIAATLGRPEAAVADALAALTVMGFIERLQDPLNGERSACVIVKPIARLHQLVIAPHEAELAAGQADRVWARARATVGLRIYRPHFASVARQWCLRHAAEATLGGVARAARPTAIACCAEHRQEHELEAVFVADPVATGCVHCHRRDQRGGRGRWTPGSSGGLSTCAPCCRANESGSRPGCCCSAGRGSRPASPGRPSPAPTSSSSTSSAFTRTPDARAGGRNAEDWLRARAGAH